MQASPRPPELQASNLRLCLQFPLGQCHGLWLAGPKGRSSVGHITHIFPKDKLKGKKRGVGASRFKIKTFKRGILSKCNL